MDTEILNELVSSENIEEAEKVIERYYPNWLVLSLKKYCADYPHLQKNWEYLCQKLNTKTKKIVLVNEIVFENTPTTLNKICDIMTKNGYVVRRSNEFLPCCVCEEAAIPCVEVWSLLKEKGFSVPKSWSNKCKSCNVINEVE